MVGHVSAVTLTPSWKVVLPLFVAHGTLQESYIFDEKRPKDAGPCLEDDVLTWL